jgi:hypothetical protein
MGLAAHLHRPATAQVAACQLMRGAVKALRGRHALPIHHRPRRTTCEPGRTPPTPGSPVRRDVRARVRGPPPPSSTLVSPRRRCSFGHTGIRERVVVS